MKNRKWFKLMTKKERKQLLREMYLFKSEEGIKMHFENQSDNFVQFIKTSLVLSSSELGTEHWSCIIKKYEFFPPKVKKPKKLKQPKVYYMIDDLTFRELIIVDRPENSLKVLVRELDTNNEFETLEGNLISDINDAIYEIEIMISDLIGSHKKALEIHRKQTEEKQIL